MNTANQITDLLKITGRLIGVLEREIEVLRAMQPAEIEALQQDKIALSAAYEAQIKSFAGQPGILETVQPALRAEFETVIGKFQSTLAANERALRATRETSQRVLEAIAHEIDRKRRENAGYSAGGYAAAASKSPSGQPVSVAIDERF
jgi:transketolase